MPFLSAVARDVSVYRLATRLDLNRALDLLAPLMILACLTSSAVAMRGMRGKSTASIT